MNRDNGRFMKGSRYSPATEFKKGHTPFNKGLRQSEWLSPEAIENSKATRFEKGQLPQTAKPMGHLRCSPHRKKGVIIGYEWYININWKGERCSNYNYRKYVWEKFHGEPAPKGMVFIAKNGDQKEKPTIENIDMITRAELLRMNSPKI